MKSVFVRVEKSLPEMDFVLTNYEEKAPALCEEKLPALQGVSGHGSNHYAVNRSFEGARLQPCRERLINWSALAPQGRFSLRRFVRSSTLMAALAFAALSSPAQTPSTPPSQDQSTAHHGTVIFSRSTDENGQTTTAGPTVPQIAGQPVTAPTATDAEREATIFTAFDMDVHLHLIDHKIAVRAQLTIRNGGKSPLAHLPMQISSSLDWEHIRLDGREVPFTVATLNSDVDHTGQLHEAAIMLDRPLAPGATIQLDAAYSGAISQSAKRLLAIGTPENTALHSDWDEIAPGFTGLRGLGNVVWYPASSVPVILGDGNRVFDEMGEHKLRMAGARFKLRLTVEYPSDQAPTVALINGNPAPLHIIQPSAVGSEDTGLATAEADSPALGFEAPSIFVAARASHQAPNTTLWTLPADEAAVPAWTSAAAAVTPFLQGWLGEKPRSQLTILDLPSPDDAPFETGSLLVTAISQGTPDQLTGVFAHALTHAWMNSPRAWLSEGVAHFMGTLWLEKQSGRQKSLESLESGRIALALAEPSSPGESAGQPLAQAISPVYYRTKATYIFWMLRDLIGDQALSAALRAYDPTADIAAGRGPASGSGIFEKLLENASIPSESSSSAELEPSAPRDLSWLFSDWIDADKGLPDISIDGVFPASAAGPPPPTPHSSKSAATEPTGPTPSEVVSGPDAGTWFVAVNLSNSGYAAAEVPVTVRSRDTSITQRILVPARGKTTRRIVIQGRPTQVQVNDGTVPETEASIHITNLTGAGSPDH